MNENPLLALKALGQHVWLDNLSRTLLREGKLLRLIGEDGIDGVTSNPAIFQKAIAGSPYYAEDLERLRAAGLDAEAIYEGLVIPDIQAACNILWPDYVASSGEFGYVSLEVSPELAHDAAATEAAALRLRAAVERDNLLIKVPGTPAGIQAFENLTAAGVSVNVTLIFSLAQYEAVAQAYLRGTLRWVASGGHARQVRSVASIFLSRIDTLVDKLLAAIGTPPATAMMGESGVAVAKVCYRRYRELFAGAAFNMQRLASVRRQTLLWASTGTKNLAYSDLLYVEPLIGPATINTLPDATLTAFREHGKVQDRLAEDMDQAIARIDALAGLGIDLNEVGETLQGEGLSLFAEAYRAILREMA
ncbi:transaldolase [Dechloromonas sp. A34]|uniref:transaldolase n=1 Tax=Dechloromonas sp. A34 TaxID=447588 RepID=UPI0022497B92|nr:transaldolase [Dechloromonas sp. A34]